MDELNGGYKLWKTKLFVLGLKLCAWKIRTFAINRYFCKPNTRIL